MPAITMSASASDRFPPQDDVVPHLTSSGSPFVRLRVIRARLRDAEMRHPDQNVDADRGE
jgi:hypothetical protein